jgi:dihydrolipoamide dehydrogenase
MVVGDIPTAVDIVVLGAGPGGYVAAIRAAQLGKQVAIVTDGPPGGTCLNEGCIPSKALLHAADQAYRVPQLASMGISAGSVAVDFADMQAWKRGVVQRLTGGVQQLLDGRGVQIVHGKGWFLNDHEVRVEGENGSLRYSFERCIIAVGAEAAPLPGLPFDGARVLKPTEALQLAELPPRLAVIGADTVAAEIATMFAKLGAHVRLLIPAGQRLLDGFDPLAGRSVQARLKKLGVTIEANVVDPAAAAHDDACAIVSAGLRGRTADLDLHEVGIQPDDHGFLAVDRRMRTGNPRISAVGDVTGGPPLATAAIKQAKVAAEDCAGLRAEYAPQAVPRVAWTDPEVAAVGMSAAEAQAAGYSVTTGRFPLAANGRALTLDMSDGMALLVAERESGVLLGATLIGTRASDMIGEAALALEMGATLVDLAETLHAHPGLGEALQESAEVALGRAIHILQP